MTDYCQTRNHTCHFKLPSVGKTQ